MSINTATTALTQYGSDLSCITDIDGSGLEVTGRRVLSQALARRIISPRGCLVDDPNYGTDLTTYINADIPRGGEGRIASQADAEFRKDERVISSLTTASFLAGVVTLSTTITDGAGPFSLVLAITSVGVSVLQPAD